jgi:hypothetical protein
MLSLPSCAMSAPPFSPWIVRWAPRLRARLRLMFLPAAGGGASIFRHWALDAATGDRRLRDSPPRP